MVTSAFAPASSPQSTTSPASGASNRLNLTEDTVWNPATTRDAGSRAWACSPADPSGGTTSSATYGATLAAIDSRDAWGDSVVKYTQTDDDARARIDRWTAAWRPENAEDGGDHLGLATTDLIDLRFFEDFDRLELRLHPDHKPFATNGRWDATANTVTWSRTLNASAEDSTGLPVTAVALWCEPDAAEQGRRLGTIGLVDEDLASYCLQRLALPRSQSEEWESFLSSLGPGEQPGARLRAFRFKGHERDDTPPGIADVVASSLHP